MIRSKFRVLIVDLIERLAGLQKHVMRVKSRDDDEPMREHDGTGSAL